jgi:hypothetical protein
MPNFLADVNSCRQNWCVFQMEFYFSPVCSSYIEYIHYFNHPVFNERDIKNYLSLFGSKLLGNEYKEIIFSPVQEEDQTQKIVRYSLELNIRCTGCLQDCAGTVVSEQIRRNSYHIHVLKLQSWPLCNPFLYLSYKN